MKRILLCLLLLLSLILTGCSIQNNDAINEENDNVNEVDKLLRENKRQENFMFPEIDYTEEQEHNFKTAYLNSISEYLDEEGNISEISIMKYYGQFGKVDMVSMGSSYRINPYKVYSENIEKFEFRLDHAGARVFGVYEGKLYTIKQAYEEKLIDMNDLCQLFLINSLSKSGLKIDELDAIEKKLNKDETLYEGYCYTRYYGNYNGYSAITLGNTSDLCVCAYEYIENLQFNYPYPGTHIRLIKEDEMYTLKEAYEKNIIGLNDLYDLFQIHTDSDVINKDLINMLLTPGYELHKRYIEDSSMDNLYLTKYYGKYNNTHIFSFYSTKWLAQFFKNTTDKLLNSLKYGGSGYIYVLYDGKIYLLDEAEEKGIITAEVKEEIITKKYL